MLASHSRLLAPFSLVDLLNHLASPPPPADLANFSVQIETTAESHVLYAEVPGVPRDQITLDIKGHQLVLNVAAPEQGQRPRAHGHRTFDLPKDVARDDVQATLLDGVLKVTLPKIKPAPQFSRQISVNEVRATAPDQGLAV
jgi:HSP20 family molecular chaperone IbpA